MHRHLAVLIMLLPLAAGAGDPTTPGKAPVAQSESDAHQPETAARTPKKTHRPLREQPDAKPQPAPQKNEESEAIKAWRESDI